MEEQDQNASGASQAALSREELEQHLRARAWKDDAFRQEFVANPRAVLERDYAQCFPEGKIPSGLSFKIIEEEEQTLCFVLPPKVSDTLSKAEELDADELLLVAGGVEVASTKGTCGTCYSCGFSYCQGMCTGPNCRSGEGENVLKDFWRR